MCLSGLPGKGKTASATYLAIKKYKQDNNIIKRFFYKLTKREYQYTNLVFSNYPILLDKKHDIYSHVVCPDDLCMKYRFPTHSLIILDETQRYFDSREYKRFPKQLGVFFQHHRHGSIDDIILVTQHPRRLDNKMRDLCEIFRKYRHFIKLPFIPLILITYTDYYEFEDYGKYNHVKPEFRTYDYHNHFMIVSSKNIFNHYNSKYFHVIFDELEDMPVSSFANIDLSATEIEKIGVKLQDEAH